MVAPVEKMRLSSKRFVHTLSLQKSLRLYNKGCQIEWGLFHHQVGPVAGHTVSCAQFGDITTAKHNRRTIMARKKPESIPSIRDIPFLSKIGHASQIRPRGCDLFFFAQAGLLTSGSSYRPHLPSLSASGILQLSSPVTAAGPSPISTGFPIILYYEHLNKRGYINLGGNFVNWMSVVLQLLRIAHRQAHVHGPQDPAQDLA
jgi:hypothetical protein